MSPWFFCGDEPLLFICKCGDELLPLYKCKVKPSLFYMGIMNTNSSAHDCLVSTLRAH